MSQKRPEGGEVHKLTVTFRSWIPQEEEAWRWIGEETKAGRSVAGVARGLIVQAFLRIPWEKVPRLEGLKTNRRVPTDALSQFRQEYPQDEREQLPVDIPTYEDVEDA